MEGRREDVKTYPSPFFYAVSPPCEVDGLSQIWSLPGICQNGRSAVIRSQAFMSTWPFFTIQRRC